VPRRAALVVATLAAAITALAFSGCYNFSGVTLSKTKLKPGHGKAHGSSSVSKVKVYSVPAPNPKTPQTSIFFLLIGVPDDGDNPGPADNSLKPSAGKFDVTGKFFNRPIPLHRNNDLRDFLVSDGGCGEFDFSQAPWSNMNFAVFASRHALRDDGSPAKQAVTTAKIKQVRRAVPNDELDINPSPVLIATGGWADDGDDTPDSDDFITCGGGADVAVFRKGANINKASRGSGSLSELRRLFGG
jgi:hypothetical protein